MNFKIKNKGVLIALIVLFIVIILAVVLFPKFKTGFTGVTKKVYQLKISVPAKTKITKDMIEEVEFPLDYIKDSNVVISDETEIIDNYSKVDISNNDIISKDKITNKADVALFSKGNLVGVTVATLSSSVAGKISSGDMVKVYGYVKKETETGMVNEVIAPKELAKLEVAYILTSQAKDTNSEDAKDKSNIVPNVVVLKVTDEKQTTELVKLEYSGKIHLEKINWFRWSSC